jgi:hypothetical protein
MPKGVWLLFLRECSLLDNALGHLEAGDLFDKAFRQQEAEAGTGPPEPVYSSWNRRSRLFERHVSGRASRQSDDGRPPSHGSGRSSGSGSRASESFRRLSDLVSERPESRERIKAGSRPFRSSRDALFRRESGTERNRSPAHPVTPYSADCDSVRRLSSQSIPDRPESGGSYLDRPDSGGSYLNRPVSGGSYLEPPDSAWSNLGRPDSSGSNLGRPGSGQGKSRRPDSAVRRPGSAGSNLSRPKSSHRSSRKTEGNDGAKLLAGSETLLGFEGFREALWLVIREKYTNLKEAQEAQAAVPVIDCKGESRQSDSTQPATTTTIPPSAGSIEPESAVLSGTPSDEEEVELALMALVSDVVSECHVANFAVAGRDCTRVKSPSEPALSSNASRSTSSNHTEIAARTALLSEVKRFSDRANSSSLVVGVGRVGTNIETVHAEKEEEAFTRLLLGRHVASLEHRVVMDRAFLGIMKPQYFDILRDDLILLYQVRHIIQKRNDQINI